MPTRRTSAWTRAGRSQSDTLTGEVRLRYFTQALGRRHRQPQPALRPQIPEPGRVDKSLQWPQIELAPQAQGRKVHRYAVNPHLARLRLDVDVGIHIEPRRQDIDIAAQDTWLIVDEHFGRHATEPLEGADQPLIGVLGVLTIRTPEVEPT